MACSLHGRTRGHGRWLPCALLVELLLAPGAVAQLPVPTPFTIVSVTYRDLDGDHDLFPDPGETGRLVITVRNGGQALTGGAFGMTSNDPDVACLFERHVTAGDLAAGQAVTLGSLDPAQPGFAFRASDLFSTPSPTQPARIDLCLRGQANEIQGMSQPVCFFLPAGLDAPAGTPQTFITGPDGVMGTEDDGTFLESFDTDRDGDGNLTVNDTFRLTDGGTGLTDHGTYLRGAASQGSGVLSGVACGGFVSPAEGNAACILDPDFPMDWHLHCPPGATNCPNSENGPCTDPSPEAGACTYATPGDGQKALSPPNSLHMGVHFLSGDSRWDTTHFRSLQAFVSSPLNLALVPRPGDLQLSMFHIADLMDNNGVGPGNPFQCADCGDVQVQVDHDPAPAIDVWGTWGKLVPFQNAYDHTPNQWSVFGGYYCVFTPTDAGTTSPAPRGFHETMCHPQGAWSHCGSVRGTTPQSVGDCEGPGVVDPSGSGVWVETRFDLSSYVGQRIRLRWLGSSWTYDGAGAHYVSHTDIISPPTTEDGWWLDNIEVTGLLETQVPPVPDTKTPPTAPCPAFCPDTDGDGYGSPGIPPCPGGPTPDCDDLNAATHPGASEVNDARDNQCPGDPGFGGVDEVSGTATMNYPGAQFCWPPQSGASTYQVARSSRPDFSLDCTTFQMSTACANDTANPARGTAFFYLVRAMTPHAGSWGQYSSGAERSVICAP